MALTGNGECVMYVCVYIYIYVHVCTHSIYMCIYCVCVYIYIYIYVHTHVYMYIKTLERVGRLSCDYPLCSGAPIRCVLAKFLGNSCEIPAKFVETPVRFGGSSRRACSDSMFCRNHFEIPVKFRGTSKRGTTGNPQKVITSAFPHWSMSRKMLRGKMFWHFTATSGKRHNNK